MKNLKIHCLQHVSFEGLGCIENWIKENEHSISYTKFYESFQYPDLNKIDWIIVMGGPMGVYDEEKYAWLASEKQFIREAILKGKTVLGICLGSQLIAEVLGAKVYPNRQKEIGWYNIYKTTNAQQLEFLNKFEPNFTVFHWHGDTYDLPVESVQLFKSDVCENQAFLFQKKVLGLQFHLEVTHQTLTEMVENGKGELTETATIQSANKILEQNNWISENNRKMAEILDYLAE